MQSENKIKVGDICTFMIEHCDRHGKRSYTVSNRVKVMAVVDKYAMVRFKGCTPFVKRLKELELL
jgi:hypothetical protein